MVGQIMNRNRHFTEQILRVRISISVRRCHTDLTFSNRENQSSREPCYNPQRGQLNGYGTIMLVGKKHTRCSKLERAKLLLYTTVFLM